MNESILDSVKKLLGIHPDHTHFDHDLIIHINSALMVLRQIGIGDKQYFVITDASSKWTDFVSDIERYEIVKSYVCAKVRLLFDPPTSSSHKEALKDSVAEFEWRLRHAAEFPEVN